MEIIKKKLRASPFIGVFALLTEKIVLLPMDLEKKEVQEWENILGVKAIQLSLSGSSLLGLFAKGLGGKIVVPDLVEKEEINVLEKNGVKVKKVKELMAIGNLVAVNKNGGIASPLLKKETVKELEEFFGVKFIQERIAGNELAGASIVVSNNGFIVHPEINEKEFNKLKKLFKVHGTATTANYGDAFVGNNVLANSKGIAVGELTTGHEIIRIDEGLRGENAE